MGLPDTNRSICSQKHEWLLQNSPKQRIIPAFTELIRDPIHATLLCRLSEGTRIPARY